MWAVVMGERISWLGQSDHAIYEAFFQSSIDQGLTPLVYHSLKSTG